MKHIDHMPNETREETMCIRICVEKEIFGIVCIRTKRRRAGVLW